MDATTSTSYSLTPTRGVRVPLMLEPTRSELDIMFTPFFTKDLRRAFLTKIYTILSVQLLITFLIVYFLLTSFDASLWIRENQWSVYVSIGLTLVLMTALACCPHIARCFPCNIFLLGLITACKCLLITVICWYYQYDDILLAMGITVAVFVVLSLFACQTKWDFTGFTSFLLVFFLLLMIVGIVGIFFEDHLFHVIYASLVVLGLSMAIVIDTQLMLIGKHSHSFEPQDYVFAALVLYSDIITLFIYILRLIGLLRTD